jgi:hypothetical protein
MLVARVVSVGLAEGGRHFLHCQAVDLSPDARARLAGFLRSKDRARTAS